MEAFFFYNPDWASIKGSSFNGFLVEIFDPLYHDRGFVVVGIKLEDRTTDY